MSVRSGWLRMRRMRDPEAPSVGVGFHTSMCEFNLKPIGLRLAIARAPGVRTHACAKRPTAHVHGCRRGKRSGKKIEFVRTLKLSREKGLAYDTLC